MTSAELLVDAFNRIRESLHAAVDGLSATDLARRLDPDANSIAWLAWHLARVQDDHVAAAAGSDQVWLSHGWREEFNLPFPAHALGYGQDSDEVGQVRPKSAELLLAYYDAVHEQSLRFLARLSDGDLDRVVDDNFDPPVTLGVRLVSVVNDCLQHVGQAAFVRGVLSRSAPG
jgi:uncharacterized damage-inducible protein DinB